MSELELEIVRELGRLTPDQRQSVLSYVKAIASSSEGITGTPGVELMKFAGVIDQADLTAMAKAIEEGCERVDQHEW